MIKNCSKCNNEPRLPGKSYCRECYNAYQRDRYLKQKAEYDAMMLEARLEAEAQEVARQIAELDNDPRYQRPSDLP
jgi:hypothetical protein